MSSRKCEQASGRHRRKQAKPVAVLTKELPIMQQQALIRSARKEVSSIGAPGRRCTKLSLLLPTFRKQ
eukprot:700066-Prymnesium_polylepis.1